MQKQLFRCFSCTKNFKLTVQNILTEQNMEIDKYFIHYFIYILYRKSIFRINKECSQSIVKSYIFSKAEWQCGQEMSTLVIMFLLLILHPDVSPTTNAVGSETCHINHCVKSCARIEICSWSWCRIVRHFCQFWFIFVGGTHVMNRRLWFSAVHSSIQKVRNCNLKNIKFCKHSYTTRDFSY